MDKSDPQCSSQFPASSALGRKQERLHARTAALTPVSEDYGTAKNRVNLVDKLSTKDRVADHARDAKVVLIR